MIADRRGKLATFRFVGLALVAAVGVGPGRLAVAQETEAILSGRVVVGDSFTTVAARRPRVTVAVWPAPTARWLESALDPGGGQAPLQRLVADMATGRFQFSLPAGHRYRLTVEGAGLAPQEIVVLAEAQEVVLPDVSLGLGYECRFRVVARAAPGTAESGAGLSAVRSILVWTPVPVGRAGWRPATQSLLAPRSGLLAVRVASGADSFVSVPHAADIELRLDNASNLPLCPVALSPMWHRNPPYRVVRATPNGVQSPYIVEVGDAASNPLPGARVWLGLRQQAEPQPARAGNRRTGHVLPPVLPDFLKSGVDGTVALVATGINDSEYSARSEDWSVYAWAPGYLPSGHSLGSSRDIKVSLEPATELVGLVLANGQPVDGATVSATALAPILVGGALVVPSTRTDREGAYRVRNVRPGERLLLTATKAELGTDTAGVVATPLSSGPTRRNLSLSLDFKVRGVVRTGFGEPLAGAEVAVPNSVAHVGAPSSWPISGRGGRRSRSDIVRTDTHGRFSLRLSQAWAGKRQSLVIAAPGRAVRSITLPRLVPERVIVDLGEIVLEPGERIEGTIHDREGTPIADARVIWSPSGREESPGLGAYSMLAGAEAQVDGARFLIDGLRQGGAVDLHFSAPGFLPLKLSGVRPDSGPIEAVLMRGINLIVRVEDENGDDLQCTVVDLRPSGQKGKGGGLRHRCTPGPEQSVAGLAPGTYGLTVGAVGFELARDAVLVNSESEMNHTVVRLQPLQAELVGWVSADGGPLSDAGVRVGRERVTTDRMGRFELRARSGRQVIEVEHPGTMVASRRRVNLTRGANEVLLDLTERQFGGQVVDAAGEPVVGASVSLSSDEIVGVFDTTSGSGGFFRLSVQPALYTVRFAARSGELEESADLRAASLSDRVWRLAGTGRLQVVLHGLSANEEAEVLLSRSPLGWGLGGFSRRLERPSDAVFELPFGEWFVKAKALSTGRLSFTTVDLSADTPEVVADVAFGENHVAGVVRLDGSEAPGVPVFLVAAEGGGLRTVTTGSGGTFSFDGVEPGTWYVSTDTVVSEIQVPTGGPVVVDIETGTAVIDVRSTATEHSISGALLELWPVRLPLDVANQLGAVRRYYSSSEPVFTGRIPTGSYRLRVSAGGVSAESLIQVAKSGRSFEISVDPK